jgi:hypothetical protein
MDKLNSAKIDPHEIRGKIQEMLAHVVNAQISLSEAQAKISELADQLNSKGAWSAIESDLTFVEDGAFTVRKSERDQGKFVPYCPVCVAHQKLVPLIAGMGGWYECAIHKTQHQTMLFREQQDLRKAKALADDSAVMIIRPGQR